MDGYERRECDDIYILLLRLLLLLISPECALAASIELGIQRVRQEIDVDLFVVVVFLVGMRFQKMQVSAR